MIYFCLVLAAQSAVGLNWGEFKRKHNINYKHQLEETMRQSLFSANKELVEAFNRAKAEKAGFRLNLNHLADKTSEELAARRGFRFSKQAKLENSPKAQRFLDDLLNSVREEDLPEEVDWTKIKGRVGPIRDQGQCGSCWAFSAVGSLEGQMEVRNVSLVELSVQNLLDCSLQNSGCDGGSMLYAWQDIAQEGGIETDMAYSYTAEKGTCECQRSCLQTSLVLF